MPDVDAVAEGGLRLLSLLSSMLAFAVHVDIFVVLIVFMAVRLGVVLLNA